MTLQDFIYVYRLFVNCVDLAYAPGRLVSYGYCRYDDMLSFSSVHPMMMFIVGDDDFTIIPTLKIPSDYIYFFPISCPQTL